MSKSGKLLLELDTNDLLTNKLLALKNTLIILYWNILDEYNIGKEI